jgi:hypothetical protein
VTVSTHIFLGLSLSLSLTRTMHNSDSNWQAVVTLGNFSICTSNRDRTPSMIVFMCCKPILLLRNI